MPQKQLSAYKLLWLYSLGPQATEEFTSTIVEIVMAL